MASIPPETAAEIQKLEQLHNQHPEGRYFVPLADRYRKLGMTELAETLLRDGLRLHPDYLSAHIVLGGCLADRGATDAAADEFRYVLSVDPQNLIALRTLGELAASRGRADEAERWYRELLTVDPMNKEARQALEALASEPPVRGGEEDRLPYEEDAPQEDSASPAGVETEMPGWGDIVLGGIAPEDDTAGDDVFALGEVTFGVGDTGGNTTDREWAASEMDIRPEPVGEDDGGLGGSQFESFSSFTGPDEDSVTDDGAAGENPDEEVVTETIAELYAQQGFHDRAAGVYRELIHRRGGDPLLEARLAAAERAARGEADPLEPELDDSLAFIAAAPSTQDAAADDPFAASFDEGFGDVAADEPDADAGSDPEWLMPWDDSASAEPAPIADPPAAGLDPVEEVAATPAAAAGADGGATAPIRQVLAALLRWTPSEEAAAAPEAPFVGRALYDDGPVAEVEPVAPSAQPEEDADLSWLSEILDVPGESDASASSSPEEAPEADEEPLDTFLDAAVNGAGGSSQEDSSPPPSAAPAGDDEDLESFQAWLQSLKR